MAKKILIVDDNEQDRKIIARFLEKIGFEEVLTAERGEEGLAKMKSEKPDLIILDTVLPGINGFETCRRIKGLQGSAIPKIIIMTGTIGAVDAVKAKEVGADDYCAKTSDFAALIKAVKKLM